MDYFLTVGHLKCTVEVVYKKSFAWRGFERIPQILQAYGPVNIVILMFVVTMVLVVIKQNCNVDFQNVLKLEC